MKILVKNDEASVYALWQANIPANVIVALKGNTFTCDDDFVVKVPWENTKHLVEWHLPSSAVTILEFSPDNGQNAKTNETRGDTASKSTVTVKTKSK